MKADPIVLLGLASASMFLGLVIGFVVYEPELSVWQLLLAAIVASVALHDIVVMTAGLVKALGRQK